MRNRRLQSGQQTDAHDLVHLAGKLLALSQATGVELHDSTKALFRRRGWTATTEPRNPKPMTMSIARLSAQSGLKYLFKTTMMDDLTVTPADATTYYMKAGTPQGRWLGSGVRGINRTAGDVVTETDAKAIFDHATHPDTGATLGRPHGQPTIVKTARAAQRHGTPSSAST